MSQLIIYIGIDVDDKAFHAGALIKSSGEVVAIKYRPTAKGLVNKLKELREKHPHHKMKLCYEATYIGFSLKREFAELGFECEVVAPNSIPRVKGNQIKTDRVDAGEPIALDKVAADMTLKIKESSDVTESERKVLLDRLDKQKQTIASL